MRRYRIHVLGEYMALVSPGWTLGRTSAPTCDIFGLSGKWTKSLGTNSWYMHLELQLLRPLSREIQVIPEKWSHRLRLLGSKGTAAKARFQPQGPRETWSPTVLPDELWLCASSAGNFWRPQSQAFHCGAGRSSQLQPAMTRRSMLRP